MAPPRIGRGASGERGRGEITSALIRSSWRAAARARVRWCARTRCCRRRPVLDRAVAVRRGGQRGRRLHDARVRQGAACARGGRPASLAFAAARRRRRGAPIAGRCGGTTMLDPSPPSTTPSCWASDARRAALEAGVDGSRREPARGTARRARRHLRRAAVDPRVPGRARRARRLRPRRGLSDYGRCRRPFSASAADATARRRSLDLARRSSSTRKIHAKARAAGVCAYFARAVHHAHEATARFRMSSLRLHDHPALLAAAEGSSCLYPVFCLERRIAASTTASPPPLLLESLRDLDAESRARTRLNSRLRVDGARRSRRAALADGRSTEPTSSPRQRRRGGRRRRSTRSPRRRACTRHRARRTRCATRPRAAPRRRIADHELTRPSSSTLRPRCARRRSSRAPASVAPLPSAARHGGRRRRARHFDRRRRAPDAADAAVLVRGGESMIVARLDEREAARRRVGGGDGEAGDVADGARALRRGDAVDDGCSRPLLRLPSRHVSYTRLAAEAYAARRKHGCRPSRSTVSCCGASSSTRAPTARRTTSGWSATRAARCRGATTRRCSRRGRRGGGTRGSTRR